MLELTWSDPSLRETNFAEARESFVSCSCSISIRKILYQQNGCHTLVFDCSTFFSHNMRYNETEKTCQTGVILKKIFDRFGTQKGKKIVDLLIYPQFNLIGLFRLY